MFVMPNAQHGDVRAPVPIATPCQRPCFSRSAKTVSHEMFTVQQLLRYKLSLNCSKENESYSVMVEINIVSLVVFGIRKTPPCELEIICIN